MLSANANIEQLIYTACGKYGHGDFGIWSASQALKGIRRNDIILEIADKIKTGNKILTRDAKGNPTSFLFDKKVGKFTVLKPDAKPSGFFKKTYKDSDYETIEKVTCNEIHLIQESRPEEIIKQVDHRDFRENEESAPFRIGCTKLPDGRLLLCRTTGVGKVYSNLDDRDGNYLHHIYIFPKGTELSDIDLSKLSFEIKIDKKYWKGEHLQQAPDALPTLTIQDLYKTHVNTVPQKQSQSQQTTNKNQKPQQTGLMSSEDLLKEFKISKFGETAKERLDAQRKFSSQVNMGANIPALLNILYEKNIEKLKRNEPLNDEDEIIIAELEITRTLFSSLFEHAEKYYRERKKRDSGDYDDYLDIINQNIHTAKIYLNDFLAKLNLQQVIEVAKSEIAYYDKLALFNHIKDNKDRSVDEEAKRATAVMIFNAATTMKEKNLSFDKQRIIS